MTFERVWGVVLVRVARLRDGHVRADLHEVRARGEVCDAVRHYREQLRMAGQGSAGAARAEEGRGTDLLDLILQLGDAVHMRQFLQHDAAMRGHGGRCGPARRGDST